MNFFSAQDKARRNTRLLLLLFIIAVATLIALTNILVAATLITIDSNSANSAIQQLNLSGLVQWPLVIKISCLVTLIISSVVIFKWLQLNAGGKYIAETLGGARLSPNTTNAEEKRALNVVEEMAIASNMPVPAVYVLPNEKGINAFAAGNTPADAVIGITRGAIEQFNREQLQGVIAHEFSHILNGDMRLNGRMIAMLSGITFIGTIGEIFLRSGGRHGAYTNTKRSNDARLAMLGAALLAAGWLGTFFGSLIKAAISRQREFLADASAVQFTRNPQGIADALKIIGGYDQGSKIINPKAELISHMYIANGVIGKSLFRTHPSLQDRIFRIEPSWDRRMIGRNTKRYDDDNVVKAVSDKQQQFATAATITAIAVAQNTSTNTVIANTMAPSLANTARQKIDQIPEELNKLAHEPFGATTIVFGLILGDAADIVDHQLTIINHTGISGLANKCLEIKPTLQQLPIALRWPLLELSLPALKLLSLPQYQKLKPALIQLINADKKIELFEWCVFQIFRHYLANEFENVRISKPIYKNAEKISGSYGVILSSLAYAGSSDKDEINSAFYRGANTAGLYNIKLLAESNCSVKPFGKACQQLSNCYPLLKAKLLKGLVHCINQDELITITEREVISVIAAVIDSPLPELDFH